MPACSRCLACLETFQGAHDRKNPPLSPKNAPKGAPEKTGWIVWVNTFVREEQSSRLDTDSFRTRMNTQEQNKRKYFGIVFIARIIFVSRTDDKITSIDDEAMKNKILS